MPSTNQNTATRASSNATAPCLMVESPNVEYTDAAIVSKIKYTSCEARKSADKITVVPKETEMVFKTDRRVPKLGVMLVGWGGNNGTTVTASIIANRENICWTTKEGVRQPNYLGSLTQASTVCIASGIEGDTWAPFSQLLPMVHPNDIVLDGWDISSMNLADAMTRAQVLDYDLQRQLYPKMAHMRPRPSIYFPDFIAANQADRADNVLTGTKQEQMEQIRRDIRDFKARENLDKVVVLWTANTERYAEIIPGMNDTADNLLRSIAEGHSEISPSTLFAVACILEGTTYINGSPQNTFVPGVIDLANQLGVFIAGDDFKSGQTKMKSVLVDFLVGAGIKPTAIVSYNHLGNNDGKNLSAPQQFRSKEISKSNVVDDMVASNSILYKPNEHPDHVVVIKYVPTVADSKRAMDEYTSEIFMGGKNTIVMHNTCEDSLLAAPIILDLVILGEMAERISYKTPDMKEFERFNCVLSLLSFLLKAPLVPEGTPVVNALFRQRSSIENIFRACIGLPPQHHMMMEYRRAHPRPVTSAVRKLVEETSKETTTSLKEKTPTRADEAPVRKSSFVHTGSD